MLKTRLTFSVITALLLAAEVGVAFTKIDIVWKAIAWMTMTIVACGTFTMVFLTFLWRDDHGQFRLNQSGLLGRLLLTAAGGKRKPAAISECRTAWLIARLAASPTILLFCAMPFVLVYIRAGWAGVVRFSEVLNLMSASGILACAFFIFVLTFFVAPFVARTRFLTKVSLIGMLLIAFAGVFLVLYQDMNFSWYTAAGSILLPILVICALLVGLVWLADNVAPAKAAAVEHIITSVQDSIKEGLCLPLPVAPVTPRSKFAAVMVRTATVVSILGLVGATLLYIFFTRSTVVRYTTGSAENSRVVYMDTRNLPSVEYYESEDDEGVFYHARWPSIAAFSVWRRCGEKQCPESAPPFEEYGVHIGEDIVDGNTHYFRIGSEKDLELQKRLAELKSKVERPKPWDVRLLRPGE